MDLDQALVQELRREAAGGATPVELALHVRDRLAQGDEVRLLAIAYFREAFFLSLQDIVMLGAWHRYSGGSSSDQELNAEVASVIERTRPKWASHVRNIR